MTGPGPDPGKEEEDWLTDEGEYLAGSIELHAHIVEQGGKPGVDFTFLPAVHDREIPEGVAEFNRFIEDMCRITVAKFPDPRALARFYREVKKDSAQSRCWYRVTVAARVDADDRITTRITDAIDPALVRADPHVKFRARQLRVLLQQSMREEEG